MIRVFQWSVWLGTVVGTLLLTLALVMASTNQEEPSKILLLLLAVLTGQDVKTPFASYSVGGCLFMVWLFSALVLSAGYKTNLLANLVAAEYEHPVRNSQVHFACLSF